MEQNRRNNAVIKAHVFNGTVKIPPSKSHTIRRLLLAALTKGISHIEQPLDSLDTRSCMAACRVLGAEITEKEEMGRLTSLAVRGYKPGADKNAAPERFIDAGNSGTTLFLAIAAAALGSIPVHFTGDSQIAERSAGPLLEALQNLGVTVTSKNGCIPITICGPWKGGRVCISCPTSQYLSALLIAAPLAPQGTITEIEVPLLNEKPYVEMTLSYLKTQRFYNDALTDSARDFSRFCIRGGFIYTPLSGPVPGDFSSAAFPAAAAVISGGKATLRGLDPGDTQGDKIFFEYLSQMGCDVQWEPEGKDWQVTVSRPGPLRGGIFDLNASPDLLPIMAVLGAFAEGETVLTNAAHARIKETDRIAVMAEELQKLFSGFMNFRCKETPDGLVLHGAGDCTASFGDTGIGYGDTLDGHGDHRIVMALACAVLGLPFGTKTVISGSEAADITYPEFFKLIGSEDE
ncbi:MAG: 3-phosphoshikimate 1-carboxyvinyltransferase [Treponema sp.]|nr:3-phosphoshikimate 1-carboxyvinyltransferase [Treponema sp.]